MSDRPDRTAPEDRRQASVTAQLDAAPPASEADQKVEALIRRQKRNLRKAWADGYLTGIVSMLKPGDLAVDCGANMGLITARLAATGADVVAFEPDPLAFETLTEKFAAMPNVTLVQAALGIATGTVNLMRADNFATNPVGASVKSTILDGGRRIDAQNAVEVPLIDFPAFVRDRAASGGIAFVKMDIEGAELDILEVMDRDGLFAHVRCLVAETHERKFSMLRPRYRALRAGFADRYPDGRVNLDWI